MDRSELYEELKKNIIVEENNMIVEESRCCSDGEPTILVNLRRAIHLAIMSSADFEEAVRKIQLQLPGREMLLCTWLLYYRTGHGTYRRFHGLLGQLFCMIDNIHQHNFERCFVHLYSMAHRLETDNLRSVAEFYAHLLATDALPWRILSHIRFTEDATTSSSRIFIKILFQELSHHLGIPLLIERLSDPRMHYSFQSIFPMDSPKNARFAITFFKSIGLGGITGNLREYLKNATGLIYNSDYDSSSSEASSSDESD